MARLNINAAELFRLWRTDLTNEELCRQIGVSRSTLDVLRMRYKLPRRKLERKNPRDYVENDPSAEEIAVRTAEIRAGWPEGEAERRMVGFRSRTWEMPAFAFKPREHSFSEISGY